MTSEPAVPGDGPGPAVERGQSGYARFCAAQRLSSVAPDAAPSTPPADPPRYVYNRYHGDAPPGAIYIGRGSPYGNPFVIGDRSEGKDGTREEVIAAHAEWILTQPALLARIRAELRGQALVCFCHPKPCHGDTIAAIANSDCALDCGSPDGCLCLRSFAASV